MLNITIKGIKAEIQKYSKLKYFDLDGLEKESFKKILNHCKSFFYWYKDT